jgi:hypothetical protein
MKIQKWTSCSKNIKWRKLTRGSIGMNNTRIQELQKQLQANIKKAMILAEKNTIRNNEGKVVLSPDDEWRKGN